MNSGREDLDLPPCILCSPLVTELGRRQRLLLDNPRFGHLLPRSTLTPPRLLKQSRSVICCSFVRHALKGSELIAFKLDTRFGRSISSISWSPWKPITVATTGRKAVVVVKRMWPVARPAATLRLASSGGEALPSRPERRRRGRAYSARRDLAVATGGGPRRFDLMCRVATRRALI
ncbi:hypothetical protein NL676_007118 [Syzygium grande]|nr:hypothetical protein NL676_007118 [Syzygium grande]